MRDRWVQVGTIVWVVSILPSLFPILSADLTYTYADQYSDVGMLLLTLAAAGIAIRRAESGRERQFWALLCVTLGSWLSVRALFVVVPYEGWGWSHDLLSDLLYLGGYLAIGLGLERRPDRVPPPGPRVRLQNLEATGALIFGFGVLTYFVLIPSVFDPEAYASWVPSLLLYAVLDAFLFTRVVMIRRSTTTTGWYETFTLLAAVIAFWFVGDIAEGLSYMEVVPWVDPGTSLDLLWHIPTLLLLVCIRTRSRGRVFDRPFGDGKAAEHHLVPQPTGRLIALALALPLIHVLSGLLTEGPPATLEARSILLVVLISAMAALLYEHDRLRRRITEGLEADRRSINDQLQAGQRLEAVGRLAAGVAHDFSNLLSVIRGRADMILMTALDETARGDAEEIVEAARRGESLVDHLLTLSRRKQLDAESLDLSEVIRDFRPLLDRVLPETFELVVEDGPRIPLVRADRGQMEQVVLNLLLNARDAMDPGGIIHISTVVEPMEDEFVARHGGGVGGDHVVLRVRDRGPGIPQGIRSAVFEPFFTTKSDEGGTGLGLSIVYGVARQAGGFVRLDDAPGGGAEVAVYLPLTRLPARADPVTAEPAQSGRETILVVEDYDPLRRTTVRVLSAAGYRVLEASNGVDALSILERRKTRVDLLLADLVLPDISGYELCDRAERRSPEISILVMSGYASVIKPLKTTGRGPVLEKPFSPQQLKTEVRAALDRSSQTTAAGEPPRVAESLTPSR